MKKTLLSLALGSLLFADYINLQITNATLMGEVKARFVNTNPIFIRGGFLYNDNSNTHNFYYAGASTEGPIIGSDLPINFSLIVDFVHTKDNSAIPIGFGVSGFLQNFKIPIFVRSEVEYAPQVLSFNNADRFFKAKAEIGGQFIENGELFVGYRTISFNKNYESAGYLGVGFSF